MKTVMIMAGGTGGHIFPALAVADSLKQRGFEVFWLGTENGMEVKLVGRAGYEMELLKFAGVRRAGIARALQAPFRLARAILKSIEVIRRRRPALVLGMGGFAAAPGGLAAALLGKPLVIHEQNSVPGLTNRLLAMFASRVLTGFPGVFGNKGRFVGNPVREAICRLPEPDARMTGREGPLRLLVVGGSRGAAALNEIVPQALSQLPGRFEVVHQTGEKDLDSVRAAYGAADIEAEVLAFVDDMARRYQECDLLICRSGALTVAEISNVGVASILVPYPHAVDDHQTGNARFLSEAGAALLLPQQELTPQRLISLLSSIDREKCRVMARLARAAANPDATEKVAAVCIELARGSNDAA